MQEFFIDKFLEGEYFEKPKVVDEENNALIPVYTFDMARFNSVCSQVRNYLDKQFDNMPDNQKKAETDLRKRAIIGHSSAVQQLTEKIKDALGGMKLLDEEYPDYYKNLGDAVFSELYGWAGLTAWANDYTPEYASSSSAKIIGENLYCMINGKAVLQPQKFSKERRDQLKRALLTAYPKERLEGGHNEVYLLREDGTHIRATIMGGEFTYPGQDVLVFRKYLLGDPEQLTFENLASYGTFPKEAIPLFESMVKLGVNIYFCGEVRSGKTTFLQTWQHYEDPTLEGTTVSSDEETDFSKITSGPLVQIIADDKKLEQAEKSLKRLDSNYIILSEVRGAAEYKFYLGITNMGTRRCKCTIHDNSAINVPYKMATEIVTAYGGNQDATIAQLYSNIDYIFELFEVPTNRALKRLKGIVELRYDPVEDTCSAHRICKYDASTDTWKWKVDIGDGIRELAMGQEDHLEMMELILFDLEDTSPLEGNTVIYPSYYKGNANRNR